VGTTSPIGAEIYEDVAVTLAIEEREQRLLQHP
jgi:hypothetical protein